MKKIFKSLILCLMIIPCSIFFVGCMKEESSGYVITFLVDNQPYLTLNTTGNEALELPDNPIKVGYTFNGWYLDEDFESLFDNEYYLDRELTEDINIYAKFTVNQYTIIFNTNEGSAIAPITQDYNSTISKPTDPTKNGYIFAGWFTDNGTFNNEYTFTTMPLNGIILYAKWSISESSAYNAYLSSIELLLNSSKLQMEYNTESKWGTTAGVEMVINNEYYHTIKYNEYPEDYCWSVQENGIWYDYMMEGYLYNGKPSYDYIKDTSIWVSETRSPQQNLVVIRPEYLLEYRFEFGEKYENNYILNYTKSEYDEESETNIDIDIVIGIKNGKIDYIYLGKNSYRYLYDNDVKDSIPERPSNVVWGN